MKYTPTFSTLIVHPRPLLLTQTQQTLTQQPSLKIDSFISYTSTLFTMKSGNNPNYYLPMSSTLLQRTFTTGNPS